jgi:hypothetical protein
MTSPQIIFGPKAHAEVVSPETLILLRALLEQAKCPACVITSTSRTPAEQARIMYANILSHGVTDQLALYAPAGDAVIGEYVKGRKAGAPPATIIAAMTAMVIKQGPRKVSLRCADPTTLNVLDIAPSSIADLGAFLQALKAAQATGEISRLFSPGTHDPAFHIEVPQSP